MGNPNDRHAEFPAQALHDVEDLRLDGHIEGGGRFVGDQNLGIARQRDGDHHALPHAPRELVRKVAQASGRFGDAHEIEQLRGPFAGSGLVHAEMDAQGLRQLVAHGEHGIQRRHRILEDEPHPGTAHLPEPVRVERHQVLTLQLRRP